uniref:Immunoglobulin domain-containing protein n=1 Tax=Lynx canadensis TaxID=61383 RepID=A0A667I3H1_LYNCA
MTSRVQSQRRPPGSSPRDGAQVSRTDGSLAGLRGHQILSPICFLPEPLPKPTLRAWPSWVAPPRSNVRLQCQTPTKNVNFALRKGNILLDFSRSPASKEGLAEFHLTDLRSSHAGDYTCECYRPGAPDIRSPPSEVILLLVTGGLPKPSLQAHQRGVVTAGDDVTLQCQRPDNIFGPMRFALLKAGAAGPIRLRTPAGREADFSLQTVTVGDPGTTAVSTSRPGLLSGPHSLAIVLRSGIFHNHLVCLARTLPPRMPHPVLPDYTTGNLIRLGLAALVVVIMGALLLEAWCSQKESPRGST